MIMGSGKTTASINLMNADVKNRYIFVTPYLTEVERVKTGCAKRDFRSPEKKRGMKLVDLHKLLAERRNIVMTHALFERCTQETLDLIKAGEYILILDEVFDVVGTYKINSYVMRKIIDSGDMTVGKNGAMVWSGSPDLKGDAQLTLLYEHCCMSRAYCLGDKVLIWRFPEDVFEAFKDVIILTYMFDCQLMKYYFDLHKMPYVKVGTVERNGSYYFSPSCEPPTFVQELVEKIHILDHDKMNALGDGYTALSSNWFKANLHKLLRGEDNEIDRLRRFLTTYYRHHAGGGAKERLWTTYKAFEEHLSDPKYAKGFLQLAARATNEYRHKNRLAYCANIFFNPFIKQYFKSYDIEIDDEGYALSMMVQWIWRSSIREGKEIWIYVPSSRMRMLLQKWLQEQHDDVTLRSA